MDQRLNNRTTEVHSNSDSRSLYWTGFIVSLAYFFPMFLSPLSSDNAIHQSMANELLWYGKLPYVGSWDQNFPAIVLPHLLASLLGGTDLSFRLVCFVTALASGTFLFRITQRFSNPPIALLTFLFFAAYTLKGDINQYGQREVFASFSLLWAMWRLLKHEGRPSTRTAIFIGSLLGFAFMVKPTYAVFLLLLPLVEGKYAFKIAIGAAMFAMLTLLPFALTSDGLEQFYYSTIRFNLDVYGAHPSPFGAVVYPFWHAAVFVAPAIAGFFTKTFRELPRRVKYSYSLLLLLSLLIALLQRKYYFNHFDTLFTLLLPLAGSALWAVSGAVTTTKLRWIVVVLFFASLYGRYFPKAALEAANQGSISDAYAAYLPNKNFGYEVQIQAKEYIERRTASGDFVEVFGYVPDLRFRINRPTATRFTGLHGIAVKNQEYEPYQIAWRRDLVSELNSNKPVFLVIATEPPPPPQYNAEKAEPMLRAIPGFNALLTQRYFLDTTFGSFEVYRRK